MLWPSSTNWQNPANKSTVKSCKGKTGSTDLVFHSLEGSGRIWEVERGCSLHPLFYPSSCPAELALLLSLSALTLSMKRGGKDKEKREGEVVSAGVPAWQLGGLLVSGSCGSHSEPCCLHVHQHVSAVMEQRGEYWISLWSGLNL